MLREHVFKLQFVYRCIHQYKFKLFLELYQVYDIQLSLPGLSDACFGNVTQKMIDFADYAHAKMYERRIRVDKYVLPQFELSIQELEYLYEQCEIQMKEYRENSEKQ